jgi:hypothetical protein
MPVLNLRRLTRQRTFRAAMGCALGCAVMLAWTQAKAGDDNEALDTKFLRGVLKSIGLQDGSETGINYQERPPLVIPPNRTLPPPETDAATKNPNWPVDPEVKRAKAIKDAERQKPRTSEEMEQQARPLPPDQLEVGQRTTSARDAGAMDERDSARPLKPSALGYKGGLWNKVFGKDEETAKFTGEPPRASLTDPPAGYQTPSPNEPYGKGNEGRKPKAYDYATEHGTENN